MTYPNEEVRETGGKLHDDLIGNSKMSFEIKEIVPLSGPVIFEFIDGVLNPAHSSRCTILIHYPQ